MNRQQELAYYEGQKVALRSLTVKDSVMPSSQMVDNLVSKMLDLEKTVDSSLDDILSPENKALMSTLWQQENYADSELQGDFSDFNSKQDAFGTSFSILIKSLMSISKAMKEDLRASNQG